MGMHSVIVKSLQGGRHPGGRWPSLDALVMYIAFARLGDGDVSRVLLGRDVPFGWSKPVDGKLSRRRGRGVGLAGWTCRLVKTKAALEIGAGCLGNEHGRGSIM